MNIALITEAPIPYTRGDSVYILELAEYLATHDFNVFVFADKQKDINLKNIKILSLNQSRIAEDLKKYEVDIVHSFYHFWSSVGFLPSYLAKVPLISEFPDDPFTAYLLANEKNNIGWLYSKLSDSWTSTILKYSNDTIIQSFTLRDFYKEKYNIHPKNILPLSVDLYKFNT